MLGLHSFLGQYQFMLVDEQMPRTSLRSLCNSRMYEDWTYELNIISLVKYLLCQSAISAVKLENLDSESHFVSAAVTCCSATLLQKLNLSLRLLQLHPTWRRMLVRLQVNEIIERGRQDDDDAHCQSAVCLTAPSMAAYLVVIIVHTHTLAINNSIYVVLVCLLVV